MQLFLKKHISKWKKWNERWMYKNIRRHIIWNIKYDCLRMKIQFDLVSTWKRNTERLCLISNVRLCVIFIHELFCVSLSYATKSGRVLILRHSHKKPSFQKKNLFLDTFSQQNFFSQFLNFISGMYHKFWSLRKWLTNIRLKVFWRYKYRVTSRRRYFRKHCHL